MVTGNTVSPVKKDSSGLLTFRKSESRDIAYLKKLALREIGRIPKRLSRHKTYMVYLNQEPIGFISYCRVDEVNLYIYMMALEKEAQNLGYARPVVRWVIEQEKKMKPVRGIKFRVYKTNAQALHATQDKYGYQVIKELPKHYVLFKKWPQEQ